MNKNKITLGKKCIESYPGRIPIIAKYKNNNNLINNFLVPDNITVGHLTALFRRKINIKYDECLSIEVNGLLMSPDEYLSLIFIKYKNQNDGCLHIVINKENIYTKK